MHYNAIKKERKCNKGRKTSPTYVPYVHVIHGYSVYKVQHKGFQLAKYHSGMETNIDDVDQDPGQR